MSKTIKVSIIIATYNRPDMLRRVLYTLLRQRDDNYEVIVSNDDDRDKYKLTESVVAEFSDKGMPVQHFYTGQYKRGSGWSVETYPYNVGIQNATGDLIILNSGDVMSMGNNIALHREAHINNVMVFATTHGLSKSVQATIDTFDWGINPMCLLFKGSTEYMFCGKGVDYSNNRNGFDYAPRPYHYQMSVSKKVLMDIRGFDEDFYGAMPGADDDLANRLTRYGLDTIYAEDILVLHQYHGQPATFTSQGFAVSNPDVQRPSDFWEHIRVNDGIVRNAHHEWGQYPRDMNKLPSMSGVM